MISNDVAYASGGNSKKPSKLSRLMNWVDRKLCGGSAASSQAAQNEDRKTIEPAPLRVVEQDPFEREPEKKLSAL